MRTPELIAIQAWSTTCRCLPTMTATASASIAQTVFDLFEEEDGLAALFGLIRDALPERLHETAYALACDVASADGKLREVELQDAGRGPRGVANRPPPRRRDRMGRKGASHADVRRAERQKTRLTRRQSA